MAALKGLLLALRFGLELGAVVPTRGPSLRQFYSSGYRATAPRKHARA